jgi:hypothetical protein
MDGFRLFQDISGKLDKGCKNAQRTCSDMQVKACIVQIAFEKKTPFFYKTKILAEGKIR